jgi:hypothetical protein
VHQLLTDLYDEDPRQEKRKIFRFASFFYDPTQWYLGISGSKHFELVRPLTWAIPGSSDFVDKGIKEGSDTEGCLNICLY